MRTYGASWNQQPEDPTRCIERVHSGWYFVQCTRKRGHGPTGEYCKQHSPESVAARAAVQTAKYEADKLGWEIKRQRAIIVDIACKIFKQEATFEQLEVAVSKLEELRQ